jgi:hypothetical protein
MQEWGDEDTTKGIEAEQVLAEMGEKSGQEQV